ncbi:MAG: FAD-dependent thymidylate synthase [Candidatus Micrarchaeia archaeon]
MDSLKPKVTILECSRDADELCALAARRSFTAQPVQAVLDEVKGDPEKAKKLLRNVVRMGHHSVIEHANFTFALEDASVFVEQFLIEFRLAAYTVKSRRYVNYSGSGFVTPSSFEAPEIKEKYEAFVKTCFDTYNYLIENGVKVEDARFILPYSFKTALICTMDARELMHFIQACTKGRGARFEEIRATGKALLEAVKPLAPVLFNEMDALEALPDDKELKFNAILGEGKGQAHAHSVELLACTEDPDGTVAAIAARSHLGESVALDDKQKKQVIRALVEDARPRELEQAWFTFRLNGMTLPILTHFTRHRMHSLLVPSFTEFSKSSKFVEPPSVYSKPELKEKFEEIVEASRRFHAFLKEEGVPREDWVYAYLSGNLVDVITTMNCRELLHFLKLRTCAVAQWEIRDYAEEMLRLCKEAAPVIFENAGPSCVLRKVCPEGKRSCGRWKAIEGARLAA